ncbi:arginine--tRNA ligase [Intestinimonas butyriciproducens]|uniref:arginine--tRNA ligase n=1 Tax=Intestinimonas butyriciproducens TaxID=1297617 RepID=UPI00195B3BB0|nr:arginine--tRNA ligase [Intestinimonas butyriciproducens]MBM6917342.1 arginine--tRNA ligase [Intestinimonas butyriciproducens]
MNHVLNAKEQAQSLILNAYRKAAEEGLLPSHPFETAPVEIPKDVKNGDFASTFAMQAAKPLGMNPRKIAEAICEKAQLEGTIFSGLEIAGPGFLNLRLGHGYFENVLRDIQEEGKNYGRSQSGKKEKIMVEFVSANPTGPMHMGNARGGVLGDSLAEVLSRAGNDVSREFYVNDAGNQIEKFAQSLEARYFQILDGEENVPFPEDGYHGDDIRELAKIFYEQHGDSYRNVSQKERHDALVQFGLEKNLAKMRRDLEKYRITYDTWFFESTLHDSGYVKETVDLLTQKGATYENEGALWLRTSDYGCEKDDVLRRANGFYTYFAADIAYHRNKFEQRGFDRVINIWGADHHGHVARLKAALDILGLDGSHRLEIVLMQLVRLMRDGEVVRMSKRTGKAITLSDLLDEISCDAARYFFNSRAADTHLEFDLGLAVREDNENPVYYVQYAHARVKSILRNLEQEGVQCSLNPDLSLLQSEEELELIRELARLPEEIRLAARDREPSRINRYVNNVAAAFHRFYTVSRIRDAETEALRDARVYLICQVATVIENGLSVFGVTAPDKM